MPSTLAVQFWRNVASRGPLSALLVRDDCDVVELSWSDVGMAVARWIARLQSDRIAPGQCVASCLPNSLDWIAIDLACQTVGIIHFPIDIRENEVALQNLLAMSAAVRVFRNPLDGLRDGLATPMNASQLEALARSVAPGSTAQLLATSGTSGSPKLVALSHRNLLSNAVAKLDAAPQFEHDLRLNVLPFAHAYARTCELSTWILSRSRLAVANGWDDWLSLAERLQPTLVNVVPYLAGKLLRLLEGDQARVGASIRLLQVGGAALSEETWDRLDACGLPPLQGYGLTEASPVVCSNRSGQQRGGTVGPAVAGVELRIDASGVLWTRGPQVMLGYWRDDAATRAVLRDGWLCTGDLVERTTDGLRIVGRKQQQIVLSTGYKVCPEIVEFRLLLHPWVSQAFVTGNAEAYLAALIWPKLDMIPPTFFVAEVKSLENLKRRAWLEALAASWSDMLLDLPHHAVPSAGLLARPLSVEEGTLNRKGAPIRSAVERLCAASVRELFAGQSHA